ncbi:hypothetical protein SNE40_010795 [Patella caerulea]|uniref:Protein FMC1 homolog n=1 Tax=Patella caerulea TaxID=87958 RepID=A0AAN8K2Q0_PATCE
MAAPSRSISLYRNLLKELKHVYKDKTESPAQIFVKDQFRNFQVTTEKVCRGRNEVYHTGETYLCLLQNLRKYEELHAQYHSQERSVESSANLVGLKLPKTYNPDSNPSNK